MKKYIIYIGILVIGLILGWFLFGGSSNTGSEPNNSEEIATNQMWTCSMHPQIMLPEPGDCPICGMDLIPAETGADGLAADEFKLSENAMALANIQTSVVGNNMAENRVIKLSGKITENEENNTVQVSYFSGRIERLNVNFTGEKIRKGQLLATIYSPELFAAQQELLTAASLKESQPALYKAVRNKLKLWKLSESQINDIETSGKIKENFPVYATVSGTVSEKLVEQGDYIKQGQPLLKIANLNTVWANFDVYENQISLFKIGQEVSITTNSYPNKEFNAKVSFIDPVLNLKTRTITLRTVLNNATNIFKPGMFVEGNIENLNSTKEKTLIIPSTAVLWTGKRSVVYIKTNPDESIFEMREIILGNNLGENYEVISGLNNGDEIVTNGTFTVDAAAQLQGKKSMMNQKGGKVSSGHDHGGSDKNADNESEDMSNMVMIDKSKIDKKFKQQLGNVVTEYIKLKNALVVDNTNIAQMEAKNVKKSLENVDMLLLLGDAHNVWMKALKPIQEATAIIQDSKEIGTQRNSFLILSKNLSDVINLLGIETENGQALYLEFCSMADNNKGGYWLSYDKEIKNPFYGESMLTCGEVKATY